MRVLVMGSGGVGGYFGGLLQQAGHEVVFTARGPHLEALKANGLTLIDRGETKQLSPVTAVRTPAEAGGTFDLILFTVKTYDTSEAAAAIEPVVGPNTSIVPLQNGVDATDEIGAVVGADRVLGGSTNIGARINEPGVVERFSPFCNVTVGEPKGGASERVEAIVAALRGAGVDEVTASLDITRAVWEKFMLLAPLASTTSAANVASGKVRGTSEGHALWKALMQEVQAVGRASGVNLPDESTVSVEKFFLNLPDTHTTSMQRDYDAQRRVELEHLAGTVIRRGKAVGVPTPTFDIVYAVLRIRALSFGGLS
ncbi:MAG: 2-dehydropantoate 2-reductase [Chloroflexi bacterium]|nr:2-dehydropantoate 2-reductase [Chloroflexota bacterium]